MIRTCRCQTRNHGIDLAISAAEDEKALSATSNLTRGSGWTTGCLAHAASTPKQLYTDISCWPTVLAWHHGVSCLAAPLDGGSYAEAAAHELSLINVYFVQHLQDRTEVRSECRGLGTVR